VSPLGRGLYEQLITEALAAELDRLPPHLAPERRDLQLGEAADRLALHVSRFLRAALQDVADEHRVETGVSLVRQLIDQVTAKLELRHRDELPLEPARLLAAIYARRPDNSLDSIGAPLIPLLDTTLLTNAPGEPGVGHQIATEIDSADRIEVVMAFLRRSGLRPLIEPLRRALAHGTPVRVLTTTYTNSTEAAAIETLRDLGADVRVSYDTTIIGCSTATRATRRRTSARRT
jgi:hypothetical protein